VRPIKFRAWETYENRIYSWEELCEYNMADVFSVHDETSFIPMQYTGFHDKNGREIYDGDILHSPAPWPGASDSYTKVFWHQGRNAGWYETLDGKTMTELDGDACSRLREIVGNILENPDLIREKPAIAGGED
jgi:uncharacterized phage protein (TIGR01671 family)